MTSYLEMDLPNGFSCQPRDGSKWACVLDGHIQDFNLMTNAVMAGPYDNNAGFMGFFGKGFKGYTKKAKFMYIKSRNINGQTWIEAQHEDSEKLGYISRYLLSAKDANSFIVVFNIKKSLAKKYAPKLYAMVQSLRLRKGFKAPKNSKPIVSDGLLGYLKVKSTPGRKKIFNLAKKLSKTTGVKEDNLLLYLGAGLVVLVIFIIVIIRRIKRRRKKKQFF